MPKDLSQTPEAHALQRAVQEMQDNDDVGEQNGASSAPTETKKRSRHVKSLAWVYKLTGEVYRYHYKWATLGKRLSEQTPFSKVIHDCIVGKHGAVKSLVDSVSRSLIETVLYEEGVESTNACVRMFAGFMFDKWTKEDLKFYQASREAILRDVKTTPSANGVGRDAPVYFATISKRGNLLIAAHEKKPLLHRHYIDGSTVLETAKVAFPRDIGVKIGHKLLGRYKLQPPTFPAYVEVVPPPASVKERPEDVVVEVHEFLADLTGAFHAFWTEFTSGDRSAELRQAKRRVASNDRPSYHAEGDFNSPSGAALNAAKLRNEAVRRGGDSHPGDVSSGSPSKPAVYTPEPSMPTVDVVDIHSNMRSDTSVPATPPTTSSVVRPDSHAVGHDMDTTESASSADDENAGVGGADAVGNTRNDLVISTALYGSPVARRVSELGNSPGTPGTPVGRLVQATAEQYKRDMERRIEEQRRILVESDGDSGPYALESSDLSRIPYANSPHSAAEAWSPFMVATEPPASGAEARTAKPTVRQRGRKSAGSPRAQSKSKLKPKPKPKPEPKSRARAHEESKAPSHSYYRRPGRNRSSRLQSSGSRRGSPTAKNADISPRRYFGDDDDDDVERFQRTSPKLLVDAGGASASRSARGDLDVSVASSCAADAEAGRSGQISPKRSRSPSYSPKLLSKNAIPLRPPSPTRGRSPELSYAIPGLRTRRESVSPSRSRSVSPTSRHRSGSHAERSEANSAVSTEGARVLARLERRLRKQLDDLTRNKVLRY